MPHLVPSLTRAMRALLSKRASVEKATALSCTVVSTLTAASDEAAMVLVARPVCTVRLKGEFTAFLPNPVAKAGHQAGIDG